MQENYTEYNLNQRNTAMDWLRIIAMLCIVGIHLVESTLGLNDIESGVIPGFRFVPLSFLKNLFAIGVNLFFLLSGYFKINLRISKIASLLFKVYFYYLVSQLLALAIGIYNPGNALGFFFDFGAAISKYWFIIVYVLLSLVAPLLNSFTASLSKANAKYFVFISIALFTVGGFIADWFYPYFGTGKGFLPLWAWVVYIYGRLIKIYWQELKIKPLYPWLCFSASILLNFGVIQIIYFVSDNGKLVLHFFAYNNPCVILSAVSLFIAFCCFRPVSCNFATFVAKHSLSVYLLHSNNPLIAPYRGALIEAVQPFWAKLLLLVPNMLCLFALGVAVDALYEFAADKCVKAVKKLRAK